MNRGLLIATMIPMALLGVAIWADLRAPQPVLAFAADLRSEAVRNTPRTPRTGTTAAPQVRVVNASIEQHAHQQAQSAPARPQQAVSPVSVAAAPEVSTDGPQAVRTRTPTQDPASLRRPMLAIVIDDLGWDFAAGERVIDLAGPVTVAVLPGTPQGIALAAAAHERGHEIILHQPMEALDARYPGPGAMDTALRGDDLTRILTRNLADVPHHVGVSNHMGSRLTAEPQAMTELMAALAARDLYFLDSRTTPQTVALDTALAQALPATRRDVFLDPVISEEVVEQALDAALALAERRGHALAIGHPHAVTMRVLERRAREISERVELVPVSRLIEHLAANSLERRAPVQLGAQ